MRKLLGIICVTLICGCGKSDEEIYLEILKACPTETYFVGEDISFACPNIVRVKLIENLGKGCFYVYAEWLGIADNAFLLRASIDDSVSLDWKFIYKRTDYFGENKFLRKYIGMGSVMPMTYAQWDKIKEREITFSILDKDGKIIGKTFKTSKYGQVTSSGRRVILFERLDNGRQKRRDKNHSLGYPRPLRKNSH